MNVINAVEKGLAGNAIMNLERNEWIIISGGMLRWKSNRQPATLTPRDIMTDKWICEDDLITISKLQIEEALKLLSFSMNEDGDITITNQEKFFEYIVSSSHTNSQRLPAPLEAQ